MVHISKRAVFQKKMNGNIRFTWVETFYHFKLSITHPEA